MKKLLVVLLVVGVVVVAGLALLLMNAGALVKQGVEGFGSDATGTKVKLADVTMNV